MSKIFISGHRGMVGSALVRAFEKQESKHELLLVSRGELDLLNQSSVADFIRSEQPDVVINAAAKGEVFMPTIPILRISFMRIY